MKMPSSASIPDLWTAGPALSLSNGRPRLRLLTEEGQHSVNQYSVVKDRTRHRRGLLGGIFKGQRPYLDISPRRLSIDTFWRFRPVPTQRLLLWLTPYIAPYPLPWVSHPIPVWRGFIPLRAQGSIPSGDPGNDHEINHFMNGYAAY